MGEIDVNWYSQRMIPDADAVGSVIELMDTKTRTRVRGIHFFSLIPFSPSPYPRICVCVCLCVWMSPAAGADVFLDERIRGEGGKREADVRRECCVQEKRCGTESGR